MITIEFYAKLTRMPTGIRPPKWQRYNLMLMFSLIIIEHMLRRSIHSKDKTTILEVRSRLLWEICSERNKNTNNLYLIQRHNIQRKWEDWSTNSKISCIKRSRCKVHTNLYSKSLHIRVNSIKKREESR